MRMDTVPMITLQPTQWTCDPRAGLHPSVSAQVHGRLHVLSGSHDRRNVLLEPGKYSAICPRKPAVAVPLQDPPSLQLLSTSHRPRDSSRVCF